MEIELEEEITKKSIDKYIEIYEPLKIEDLIWLNDLSLYQSNISFHDKLEKLIKGAEEIEYFEGCHKLHKIKEVTHLLFKQINSKQNGSKI